MEFHELLDWSILALGFQDLRLDRRGFWALRYVTGFGLDRYRISWVPDRCYRWWIAGIEQGSILAILIVAIARIVCACFHKMAGIAGVVHCDPNDYDQSFESNGQSQVWLCDPFEKLQYRFLCHFCCLMIDSPESY